jgi:hypothetical protein
MARHNLHSFTLSGGASKIINKIRRGKKSAYASKAIIWFSEPQEVITEKHWVDQEGPEPYLVNHHEVLDLSEQIMSHYELMDRYSKVCKENVKLREELQKNESFVGRMLKVFKN